MPRNLVIVRAGDHSLHRDWLKGARDWDMIVNYYGDDPDRYRDLGPGICRIDSKGPKWPALHELIGKMKHQLDAYDYIWFPDDDLACEAPSINQLFAICREHHLDLAQPALTYDSHIGVSITVANRAFLLRYTNYIEIMAPCFKRTFLDRCWPTFTTSFSGWGLDFVWPRMLDDPMKAAIIDTVQVKHTRPHGGPNYHLLQEKGIDPNKEFADLLAREKIDPQHIIKGGIDQHGKLLGLWKGDHQELIQKIMAGYLPEFTNFPDLLFTILEPILQDLGRQRKANS